MAVQDWCPPDLISPDKKEQFIRFLQALPVHPKQKKYGLLQWGEVVDHKITEADILRVTGVSLV